MLTDLIIKNFAIIESLHVSFSHGFNVLTGETGAGKSIIIDAVNLLLGGRARGEVIRTGSEDATVEAVFDVAGDDAFAGRLEEAGLPSDDEFMVRRIVSRSGKNRIFINGSTVTLGQLRELTGGLVNIYGQNEHQHLQKSETHLEMLDNYAGLKPELEAYRDIYRAYLDLQQQLRNMDMAERDRRQRLDMLTFQQQELSAARLVAGEDVELEQERSLLQHSEKLTAASRGGYELLYGGQAAVYEKISEVADQLEALDQVDPQLGKWAESLRNHQYGLEDIASELHAYSEKLDFEPERQQQVEDRLALLTGLKRKYAPTLVELIDYLDRITQEIEQLSDFEQHREGVEQKLVSSRSELLELGQGLSRRRREAAADLASKVMAELADLAMPKALFAVEFTSLDEPAVDGLESAEFYLAANPGEDPQPLAKIASGGELSRIMLALKRSAPEGDGVATLIFDEVDAGIGGEAATAVGEKIGRLGRHFQVLCVTHLPQVAAFADQHYHVVKQEQNRRTVTSLTCLDGETRVSEIARMLGGLHAGEQAFIHARELIDKSDLK